MSTQSSGAPRVLKDGGDDQRESQVELLLQRQIHKDTGDDKRGSDPDPSCNTV